MYLFLRVFLAIVLTEALTEIVTKSEIFEPLRKKLFELGQNNRFFSWLHKLFDCGYCFSVWSGVSVAFLLLGDLPVIYRFIFGLVFHRLANLFHNIMDRIHGI